MKPVTILIPTRFNNRWILELNLRSIRKYTHYPYRLIVGDAGIDEEVAEFLEQQRDVRVVRCPDPLSPKDHLARAADTPYFLFLHDDAQILQHGWLTRRVRVLERRPDIAVVGPVGLNHAENLGWRAQRVLKPIRGLFSPTARRFFPFALLVDGRAQEDLGLFWGRHQEFDPGSIAYLQLMRRRLDKRPTTKRWRFVEYGYKPDVKHWRAMTWPVRQKHVERGSSPFYSVDRKLEERDEKTRIIKKILENESF